MRWWKKVKAARERQQKKLQKKIRNFDCALVLSEIGYVACCEVCHSGASCLAKHYSKIGLKKANGKKRKVKCCCAVGNVLIGNPLKPKKSATKLDLERERKGAFPGWKTFLNSFKSSYR